MTTSDHKTDDDELKALDKAFSMIIQLPYNPLGPNSNTYAHRLLDEAGFDVIDHYVTVPSTTGTDVVKPHLKDPDKSVYSPKRPAKAEPGVLFVSVLVGSTATTGWDDKSYGGSEYDKNGNKK